MAIRIAVDAMGGDNAPEVILAGVEEVLQSDRFELALVGPSDQLRSELSELGLDEDDIQIIHAPEQIGMEDAPATAVKEKTRSSIHVGLQALKEDEVDAFVSAGNTGAVMAASLFVLGRLENVMRPSVVGFYPTLESTALVLDIGANVDCRPKHLYQFGRMGSLYAQHIMKRERPSVGLMNVGHEPGKGTELVKEAYHLLEQEEDINFVGNIEGGDVLRHGADVVVCDGFVGNITLKLGESLPQVYRDLVKAEMQKQELSPSEQKLVAGVLRGVQERFDYEEYGGAPLLGVNGTVFVGHGSSTPRAVSQLIRSTGDAVRNDMTGVIASAFKNHA